MKVLIAHCRYQRPGGEDMVAATEAALLEKHGHEVRLYQRDNHDVARLGSIHLASECFWSGRTVREVTDIIAKYRPHVTHAHNTFPLISPSLYWAAQRVIRQKSFPGPDIEHVKRHLQIRAIHIREFLPANGKCGLDRGVPCNCLIDPKLCRLIASNGTSVAGLQIIRTDHRGKLLG